MTALLHPEFHCSERSDWSVFTRPLLMQHFLQALYISIQNMTDWKVNTSLCREQRSRFLHCLHRRNIHYMFNHRLPPFQQTPCTQTNTPSVTNTDVLLSLSGRDFHNQAVLQSFGLGYKCFSVCAGWTELYNITSPARKIHMTTSLHGTPVFSLVCISASYDFTVDCFVSQHK